MPPGSQIMITESALARSFELGSSPSAARSGPRLELRRERASRSGQPGLQKSAT